MNRASVETRLAASRTPTPGNAPSPRSEINPDHHSLDSKPCRLQRRIRHVAQMTRREPDIINRTAFTNTIPPSSPFSPRHQLRRRRLRRLFAVTQYAQPIATTVRQLQKFA